MPALAAQHTVSLTSVKIKFLLLYGNFCTNNNKNIQSFMMCKDASIRKTQLSNYTLNFPVEPNLR
jgi:hypothetical protein